MLNFGDFEVLSFDCYGTMIDWETGLLNSLQPILRTHKIELDDQMLLIIYGELEALEEAGDYQPYRDILKNVLKNIGLRFGFTPSPFELENFPETIKDWQPFPDTVSALQTLAERFKLAVISNIDDDLFKATAAHLQIPFDWVITAQNVQSYKPSLKNFQKAIEVIGLPVSKILHVAQSLYHDIAPAKSIGLATVWINRRYGQEGSGATPASKATPDLIFPDLQSLAESYCASAGP